MRVCQINNCSVMGKLNFIGAIFIIIYHCLRCSCPPALATGLCIYGILEGF